MTLVKVQWRAVYTSQLKNCWGSRNVPMYYKICSRYAWCKWTYVINNRCLIIHPSMNPKHNETTWKVITHRLFISYWTQQQSNLTFLEDLCLSLNVSPYFYCFAEISAPKILAIFLVLQRPPTWSQDTKENGSIKRWRSCAKHAPTHTGSITFFNMNVRVRCQRICWNIYQYTWIVSGTSVFTGATKGSVYLN